MTPARLVLVAAALVALAGPARALTGREVINTAQERNGFSTWHDRTVSATMETYDKGTLARTRELDISEQTDPRGEHRTFMRFTSPSDVQNTRFLHLSPRGDKDQQWLWAPSTRRTRRLGEAQRDENFFGADLSYRDLELLVRIQQWNDDESTATVVGEESVDGKPAYVVELVPKNQRSSRTPSTVSGSARTISCSGAWTCTTTRARCRSASRRSATRRSGSTRPPWSPTSPTCPRRRTPPSR